MGVALVCIASGLFFWTEYAAAVTAVSAYPKQNAYLNSSEVNLVWSLEGYEPGKGSFSLVVDGTAVPDPVLRLEQGEVQASVRLADGHHTARLDYNSSNVFSGYLTQSWAFTVDTAPPAIQIVSPSPLAPLGSSALDFKAVFDEPVAEASLQVDGSPTPLDLEGKTGQCAVTLSEGDHRFALNATDLAGNKSVKQWEAWAEFGAPAVAPADWPGATWAKVPSSLSFTVQDAFPDQLILTAGLDGDPVAVSAETALISSVSTGPGTASSRVYSLHLPALSEGTHLLTVSARNAGDQVTTWHQSFLVDTTETFGETDVVAGAVGKDVKELQLMLTQKGFYHGTPTAVFDAATAEAVSAYRRSRGLSAEPVVDQATIELLFGSIVVDRGKCTLYLYEGTTLVKTYEVAVGQPAYPTPTGDFVIVSKEVNPTWYPPNSPWAAGAVPVGPGPGDPLQARWMGLSSPGVGIHGTNEPSSIGSHASHGCVRMLVADVEDLYDRVFIGTPVHIVD